MQLKQEWDFFPLDDRQKFKFVYHIGKCMEEPSLLLGV